MRPARVALRAALAALIAAAGCSQGGTEDGDDGGDGDDTSDDDTAGDDGSGGGNTDCGPGGSGTVAQVIDGDTVELSSGERIRYLLVDTPESTTDVECYGPEAAQFNADVVEGEEVSLSYDQECTDDYGRVLAYVSIGDREINSLLVERGFGCALYIPPNGADRRDEFESLQAAARADNRGLWGACPENPCN
jgi:micrococcal nuclease